jgi:hypothetical protein
LQTAIALLAIPLYGDFESSQPEKIDPFAKSLEQHDTDEADEVTSDDNTPRDGVTTGNDAIPLTNLPSSATMSAVSAGGLRVTQIPIVHCILLFV